MDLVIELPTVYATQSAEGFAKGAISTLAQTGVVDTVIFGSESGEFSELHKTAKEILNLEKNSQLITEKLKEGKNYCQTLNELIGPSLNGSNNILGIEYIKQNLKLGSPLKLDTIKRIKSQYNEPTPTSDSIASATSLRPLIKSGSINLLKFIPPKCLKNIKLCH